MAAQPPVTVLSRSALAPNLHTYLATKHHIYLLLKCSPGMSTDWFRSCHTVLSYRGILVNRVYPADALVTLALTIDLGPNHSNDTI